MSSNNSSSSIKGQKFRPIYSFSPNDPNQPTEPQLTLTDVLRELGIDIDSDNSQQTQQNSKSSPINKTSQK